MVQITVFLIHTSIGQKKCKATAKTVAGNPVSKLQQRSICVKSANFYLRCQSPAPLNRVHNPAQTSVGITETSSPNAPSPALPALPETRPVETVTVLLLLTTTTLVALLFYGRVFAVFCTCFWLSLLALVCSSPVISSPGVNRVEETIDVSSPEYKKKVVLMGLLERNKPSLRRVC